MKVLKKDAIKAYKVFDENLKCRGYQYEIGKTHVHVGEISMCWSGFHACRKLLGCFDYRSFDNNNRVCEVILWGDVLEDDNKLVVKKIMLVREILWNRVLDIVNTGNSNTGNSNTGNSNTGDWNAGDWNAGDWNAGDWNAGFFNTSKNIMIFNKSYDGDIHEIEFPSSLRFNITRWIDKSDMSDIEKKNNPEYKQLGGYLKKLDYKTEFKKSMELASKSEIEEIKRLPNFDADIFYEISGFRIK